MPYLIAQEGPLKGLTFDLSDGDEWVVGRDSDEADLFADDDTVSRKQLKITKNGDEFFLKNLSRTNPSLVNDEPIQPNTPLKEGDKVKIGETIFLFTEETDFLTEEPEKKSSGGGYDDIFGDLEEPEMPPEPEPLEPAASVEQEDTEEEEEDTTPSKSAYDTIFEDVEAESEMPFNLLSETPLVLKVIGGPNAGAEIGLEKGRSYLLGKDSNSCDIVFQDLSVSRNHARLSISHDGIIDIEDLGSKNATIINGSPVEEKQIITSQDLIAMGTTIFLIIDREAAQETIYSPAIPAYEAASTAEREALSEEEAPSSINREEEKPFDWKQEKIPSRHLILAGSAAAIFLIVFISFFSLFKSEPLVITKKLPKDAIQEALEDYPGVHYAYNPGEGKLFLAGHVLTGVNYQEMQFNLSQLTDLREIENNVIIDEGVSRSMNETLAAHENWKGVTIVASSPGRFVARGYVQTAQDAASITDYLNANFPYVDLLQNKIVVEDLLRVQVQAMVLASGLGGVTSQLANGNVLLAGMYPAAQETKLDRLIDTLNKLDGIYSVRNLAIPSSSQGHDIDLSRQYSVTGTSLYDDKGFGAVINGRIYTIGQNLDGMNITSIESNTILLEKDGLKYKISYTR